MAEAHTATRPGNLNQQGGARRAAGEKIRLWQRRALATMLLRSAHCISSSVLLGLNPRFYLLDFGSLMRKNHGDKVLLAMVLILACFGLVMITSIGVPKSIQLSAPNILYPNCSDANVDCYLLFKNHLIRLIIGAFCLFICTKIPMKFWKKFSVIFFIGMFGILVLVLIMGSKYTTFAKSWFVLFNTSVEPVEFAKLALILYLANWLEKKGNQVSTFEYGFLPFCIVLAVIAIPVMLEPDIGQTMVITLIAVAMFFAAGARLRHLALGAFLAVIGTIIIVSSVGHVRDRFLAFTNLDTNCSEDYCWQSEQANIAVGSGGFWGKGLTQGVQKSYWLPQASDDFIFAASAEELGFIRIALLVLVYAVIAYRGYKIAGASPNKFTQLTAVGLATWITIQAFVNIAVNVDLMPVTGITLPFVSYGGSSLLSVMIAAGILLHISKQHSDYASGDERRGNRRSHHPQYRPYS
jgi:cell division protein FtsW